MTEMLDGTGMVDITDKPTVKRVAKACGKIRLKEKTIEAISSREVEKGDVITTARIAALQAVKDTPRIIPMCHPLHLTGIDVNFSIEKETVEVIVKVTSIGRTGVEMEALSGVSAALLTIWDMVKSMEKDETGNYPTTSITNIQVLHKIKGKDTN